MADPRAAGRGRTDDRGRDDRARGDVRGRVDDRGRGDDRGRPPGGPGMRPFRPPMRTDLPHAQTHTLRLRDGDREIEVSGSAAFIRQVMDEIPDLWSRLHGHRPAQPAAIRMPQPPAEQPPAAVADEP